MIKIPFLNRFTTDDQEFYDTQINTINYHLKEIFDSKELEQNRTIRKIRTVQKEDIKKLK